MANLVNFGILPLMFTDKKDYSGIEQGDALDLDVKDLNERLLVKNLGKGTKIDVTLSLSELDKGIVKAGGKLASIKAKQNTKNL
jgi:aconitate hydratase